MLYCNPENKDGLTLSAMLVLSNCKLTCVSLEGGENFTIGCGYTIYSASGLNYVVDDLGKYIVGGISRFIVSKGNVVYLDDYRDSQ